MKNNLLNDLAQTIQEMWKYFLIGLGIATLLAQIVIFIANYFTR